MSIKALAKAVLERNQKGNQWETESFPGRKPEGNKRPQSFPSKAQKNASDFVRFCMAHENTYDDGHCPVRHDRVDPMTHCLGWRLKTKREVIH